jgi:hypothetical protein
MPESGLSELVSTEMNRRFPRVLSLAIGTGVTLAAVILAFLIVDLVEDTMTATTVAIATGLIAGGGCLYDSRGLVAETESGLSFSILGQGSRGFQFSSGDGRIVRSTGSRRAVRAVVRLRQLVYRRP